MKRITLLVNISHRHKAGYGIEVEDAIAAMWVQQGKAMYGGPEQPLKKGNLQLYNNCTPITPAESKKALKPPEIVKAASQPDEA